MYEQIKKRLEHLKNPSIILVIIPHQFYYNLNLFLLKYFLDVSKGKAAYISLNRPYKNLMETFIGGKIDPQKIFFIDCVTKNEIDVANCYFLKSQQNVINLSIAISSVVKKEKPSFLFFDSLNILS